VTIMKKTLLRLLIGVVLVVMLASQMGCVAAAVGAAAGAGTVVYIKGNLEETIGQPTPTVHRAVIASLRDLKVPILEDQNDQMNAKVKSQFADNTHIWINVDSISATASKLSIRVGTFGEEYRSRQILDRIHRYLPSSTSSTSRSTM